MEGEIKKIEAIRHSLAHILAMAVIDLYKNVKLGIGPVIEHGFYYDFDLKQSITEEDLKKIEGRMHAIINKNLDFTRVIWSKKKAGTFYKKQPYKLELIKEKAEGKEVQVYQTGEFFDFCKGGHVNNTRELAGVAFKLMNVAGAYWKGSEKNAMLQRVYGVAFEAKEELEKYLALLEEAKKRDHRKLAAELELYTISEDVGQGLILWQPKGTVIKEELESWAKRVEREWGYDRVATPHITKSKLFYTSGHLPYYKDDMYAPMVVDKEEYYLKPMNCPFHHTIYKSQAHSYRDLPVRFAEFGTCYRYEASGQLFGLMRVRGFTQNDAHIYCAIEQAVDEFVSVMKLHEYFYQKLGITEYHLELGLRNPKNTKKYHGNEAMWKKAEELMREAVKRTNIRMVEIPGSAAFYGPKIDFVIHSAIGREFAISTNQIDLFMGERFGLTYIDKDGKEKTPAIIHRAPLGSDERFIGFLIEHYGGNFPVWLSPVQARILLINDKVTEYGKKVHAELLQNNIRVELDDSNETLGKKIRTAEMKKIPYIIVIGEREAQEGKLSVRERHTKQSNVYTVPEFVEQVRKVVVERS